MNRALGILLLLLLAAPLAAGAATYHLSPTGNDSNDGSARHPWLTPNHALQCGDVILAHPGASYDSSHFSSGKWGRVSCSPSHPAVAWLKCAVFDRCKIVGGRGILVDQSYWGVQGWEVTAPGGACFSASPRTRTETIHHIIFANNIANGCAASGVAAYNNGRLSVDGSAASVDYLAIVGNIAYNSSYGSRHCYSGLNVYQPMESDQKPGTHIYVVGNFSYRNLDPNPCENELPTDGNGIILDTFDGSQGTGAPYRQQAVIDNNILVANGARGIQIENNLEGGPRNAIIVVRQNTTYGNNTDPNQDTGLCNEMTITKGNNISWYSNIASTPAVRACTNHEVYDVAVYRGNATDHVAGNWLTSPIGAYSYADRTTLDAGFLFGPGNVTGQDPQFGEAGYVPGRPDCRTSASVPACMQRLIRAYTPASSSPARGYGYQIPNPGRVSDRLFPKWLCNVDLPAGLITMGCAD